MNEEEVNKRLGSLLDAMPPKARVAMLGLLVATLPAEQRDQVNECQRRISALVEEYGGMGQVALSMAIAELATKGATK